MGVRRRAAEAPTHLREKVSLSDLDAMADLLAYLADRL
jgi:hypothetical protein